VQPLLPDFNLLATGRLLTLITIPLASTAGNCASEILLTSNQPFLLFPAVFKVSLSALNLLRCRSHGIHKSWLAACDRT